MLHITHISYTHHVKDIKGNTTETYTANAIMAQPVDDGSAINTAFADLKQCVTQAIHCQGHQSYNKTSEEHPNNENGH